MKRLALILVVLAAALLTGRDAQAARRGCRSSRAYYGARGYSYAYPYPTRTYALYGGYGYPVYNYNYSVSYLPAYPYGFYGYPTYSYYGYAPGYAWYW